MLQDRIKTKYFHALDPLAKHVIEKKVGAWPYGNAKIVEDIHDLHNANLNITLSTRTHSMESIVDAYLHIHGGDNLFDVTKHDLRKWLHSGGVFKTLPLTTGIKLSPLITNIRKDYVIKSMIMSCSGKHMDVIEVFDKAELCRHYVPVDNFVISNCFIKNIKASEVKLHLALKPRVKNTAA